MNSFGNRMATREGERPQDDAPVASRETLALVTWSDGEAALVHNLLEQYGIPSPSRRCSASSSTASS